MLKYLLILLCPVFFFSSVKAQSVFTGRVLENRTRVTLKGVKVRNLVNRFVAATDEKGNFSIGAKQGDILVFTFAAFKPDTLLLTDLHDREIFMLPDVNMLKQVTITDSSGQTGNATKNMVLPYDPEFHGQALAYHRNSKEEYDGGITLRIHYFTKDDRDKRKAALKEEDRRIAEQIEYIFTAENIGRFIPLKGTDMDNFLMLYTPDVERYKDKQFSLPSYLNACYKEWQTLSDADKRSGQLFKN